MTSENNVIELLRNNNRKTLFNQIRMYKNISRAELSLKTGISAPAVTRVVSEFIDCGMVKEVGYSDVENVGRKPVKLSIKEDCIYALGLNIDIDELMMGCSDIGGNIIYSAHTNNFDPYDAEDVFRKALELYKEIRNNITGNEANKIAGMGVAIPGLVNWADGTTILSPQLRWRSVPLKARLNQIFDMNVLVENNVRSYASLEAMLGDTDKYNSFFAIELGSGLGAAYVNNGQVIRGENGALGEIGHSLVVENGELCDCGRRGCLQAYTCISGLENRLGMKIDDIMKNRSEERVRQVLDDAVHYLSMMVANVANYYNPNAVIVFGKLFDLWPELFDLVQEHSKKMLWRPNELDFQFQRSRFKSDELKVVAPATVYFNDILMPKVSL